MRQVIITHSQNQRKLNSLVLNTNNNVIHKLTSNKLLKWAKSNFFPTVELHITDNSIPIQINDCGIETEFKFMYKAMTENSVQYLNNNNYSKIIATTDLFWQIPLISDELIDFILKCNGKINVENQTEFDELINKMIN